MDRIKDNIERDREGRSKDKMDENFLIKTVPNCKNILNLNMIKVHINHV